MLNAYDIAYGLGVGFSSPFWLAKPSARRKVLGAFRERMGHVSPRDQSHPAILLHAVSLGEVNATTALVRLLREKRPDLNYIISTTTQTGWDRARQLYGNDSDVTLIRYPLDFSHAVERVLDALHPALVVLMELEVWPNFLSKCRQRGIPVVLANGRLTTRSFARYKLIRPIAAAMFRRLDRLCVQDETYAQRFIELGAPPHHVEITGTMKFDSALVADRIEGDEMLAQAIGLRPSPDPVWVCGSTGPGEEEVILRQYRELLKRFSRLRLVIVPRKPERFDEVAQIIESFRFRVFRRSRREKLPADPPIPPVILGDTMGELRTFYSLATIVFVGRSLIDLGSRQHGSDMIEPAALAKPIIVGPFTANFDGPVRKFRAAEALMEADDGPSLGESIRVLLHTPAEATAMGRRAQAVVRREQGATERHVVAIIALLGGQAGPTRESQGTKLSVPWNLESSVNPEK
jgi:3-deoxy-D-manno-octulosonic-acid transferase